jgi:hypothetical protein
MYQVHHIYTNLILISNNNKKKQYYFSINQNDSNILEVHHVQIYKHHHL